MERDAQSNGDATNTKESFILKPVCPEESGEGFPYAPENWPRPGDIWGWRVGRRVAITGHFLDRYLYPPKRIRNLRRSDPIAGTRKNGFASKLSLERFIRTHFPDTDVDAFFASFSWKIPSKDLPNGNLSMRGMIALPIPEENIEQSAELDALGCKAGNRTCSSLLEQVEDSPVAVMPCNFCCNEPRFCRDCCCNICCKTITSAYGGYSYVKCETVIEGGFICGHITHIDCALRAFMAGTVGGSIGLDVEFYCRRCDTKKDLLSHVTKLVQACESMDSRDDIAKILKICSSILHGSQKPGVGILMNRVQLATEKLKSGTSLEDLWRVEDDLSPMSTDFSYHGNSEMEIVKYQSPLDIGVDLLPELYNRREEDIDQVLQQLKKSQEMEYKLAEEKLYAQKNFLCYLNKQLENERLELARHVTSSDPDALVSIVINRANQIKEETMKLKEMEKVAKGFGSLPRDILEEHFNLKTEE